MFPCEVSFFRANVVELLFVGLQRRFRASFVSFFRGNVVVFCLGSYYFFHFYYSQLSNAYSIASWGLSKISYTSTMQHGLMPSWKHSFALVSNLSVSCVLCTFVQWKGARAQHSWIFSLHPHFPLVLTLIRTYRGLSLSYQRRLCLPLFFSLTIVQEHRQALRFRSCCAWHNSFLCHWKCKGVVT